MTLRHGLIGSSAAILLALTACGGDDTGGGFNEQAARVAFLAAYGYAPDAALSAPQQKALDDTLTDARTTWCDNDPLGMAVLINTADTVGGLIDAVRAGCPDQYAAGLALIEAG